VPHAIEELSVHGLALESPGFLVLILLAPALFAFVALLRRRRVAYTLAFPNLARFREAAVVRRAAWRQRVGLLFVALALTALAFALARPSVVVAASRNGAAVILLADVSGSMAATDVRPSRIGAAVHAMQTLVDQLPSKDTVGLVTFSDGVQVVTNPTSDHQAVQDGLATLHPEGGTAVGLGVEAAVKLAVASLAADGVHRDPGTYLPAAIVLESDGAQDRGDVTPAAAAKLARAAGVRIYGIALGTRRGSVVQGAGFARVKIPVPPSRGTVALLARVSGGQAFTATTADGLNTVYRQLGNSIGRHRQRISIASWFELAAAVLFVGGLAITYTRGTSLP
jgi:Ca-activated chloride channel family protein